MIVLVGKPDVDEVEAGDEALADGNNLVEDSEDDDDTTICWLPEDKIAEVELLSLPDIAPITAGTITDIEVIDAVNEAIVVAVTFWVGDEAIEVSLLDDTVISPLWDDELVLPVID